MVFRCYNSQNQTMKRNWSDIEPHWMRLSERTAFDLSAECVVIDQQNEVMETTLSGLPTFLKASAAMSNPLVKHLKVVRGWERWREEVKPSERAPSGEPLRVALAGVCPKAPGAGGLGCQSNEKEKEKEKD